MSNRLSPECGRPWRESDWDDPDLVREKRANALAYLREHPTLVADYLGQYVAYRNGKRIIGPSADEDALCARALKILEGPRVAKRRLICIFAIRKSIADVLVPEVQD